MTSELIALIREWHTAGSKKRWRTSCWHRAPDDVIAAVNSLENQLRTAERKVDAYDRARSRVKIEGNTRAEYVLRIEVLELAIKRAIGGLQGNIDHRQIVNDLCVALGVDPSYPTMPPWGPDHPSYDEMGQ